MYLSGRNGSSQLLWYPFMQQWAKNNNLYCSIMWFLNEMFTSEYEMACSCRSLQFFVCTPTWDERLWNKAKITSATQETYYTQIEREIERKWSFRDIPHASYFVHVQPVPGNIDKPTIKKRDREREKTNQRNKDKCSKKNRKKKSYKWKANE